MRKSDIIGRIGGDEFCIMAVDSDHGAVRERLKKMIDKFNKQAHLFKLSISIGVTTPDSNDEELDTIISRADQKMYEHKRSRKEQQKRDMDLS